jgi:DNA-directed RNA polymerase specialized sigma24 family protein
MKIKSDTKHDDSAAIKEIVRTYQAGQPGSDELILKVFDKEFTLTARKFSGSLQSPEEDLKQEISIWVLKKLKTVQLKDNPRSCITSIAHNFCRDLYDKQRRKPKLDGQRFARDEEGIESNLIDLAADDKTVTISGHHYIPGLEELEGTPGIELGSRNLLGVLGSMPLAQLEFLYQREFSKEFRKAIEMSIESVHVVYEWRRQLTDPKEIAAKYHRAFLLLKSTGRKLGSVFGKNVESASPLGKYKNTHVFEIQVAARGQSRIIAQTLRQLLPDAQYGNYQEILRNNPELPIIDAVSAAAIEAATTIYNLIINDKTVASLLGEERWPTTTALRWRYIRTSPTRMMFDVWKSADEVKRGKGGGQVDLGKMKLLFGYHKKRTAGTPLEYLFQNISDDRDFENQRKYQYREPKYSRAKKAYRETIELITRKSFS